MVKSANCHPGLVCFSRSPILIVILLSVTVVLVIERQCRVCRLWHDKSASSITVFSVRALRSRLLTGESFMRYRRTTLVSQTVFVLGKDGLDLKTPFMNLVTMGSCPTRTLSLHRKEESALRAVLIAL